ncbi:MAG: FAD-dependent monooxygenase [Alphaproteobacteria bacterium]|nr:FAD-dependent monooxygenase [Alphaproteobacteria bacterium]
MRRALIIGGGIGGLAAAVALQRVGVSVTVFEKEPAIAEVGAGLSIWSNAMLALRRLGLESAALQHGSIIERVRSVNPSNVELAVTDFAALGERATAPSICIHRADLQRLLHDAVTASSLSAVETGRECVGFFDAGATVVAMFKDGSREEGDLLIGADGIHSVIRKSLFGHEVPRFAGYFAWRGVAHEAGFDLPAGEALMMLSRGAHAGAFHCGTDRIYWFLTCNASPGAAAGSPCEARAAIMSQIDNLQVDFRALVDATESDAILRNDVIDRPPRRSWGRGRLTLLGDAIHATTPNLGQGACQALEDAVLLADAISRDTSTEHGLRAYEDQRRARANDVITQSWRLGKLLQTTNPIKVWLRDTLSSTALGQKSTDKLFTRLLCTELPSLKPSTASV